MISGSKNKTGVYIILALVVGVLVGWFGFRNVAGVQSLKIPFPFTTDVSGYTSLACESLMSAGIVGSHTDYLTNGIEGEVRKGTDKLAVNVKGDGTLAFLTQASVEAGVAEGDLWTVLRDTSESLIAMHLSDGVFSSQVNVFALNKETGLAVWSKTSPDFLTFGSPRGDVFYLQCL